MLSDTIIAGLMDFCFVGMVILISYAGGQERLYCSHKTLHLSILEPTVFTQITGIKYVVI